MSNAKGDKPSVFWGVLYYFPLALKELAKVSQFGTQKHGVPLKDRGFLGVAYPIEQFDDAAVRHMLARATEGEVNKEDGNLLHRAQQAWNSLAALEKYLRGQEEMERAYLMYERYR